jgi:hypothetical protein
MVDGTDLLGYWSAEHGFHTAMEDECVMFRSDGTGWYEYARPWYSQFTLFRWRLLGDGRVRIEAHEEVELDEWEGRAKVEYRSIASTADVDYSITMTQRPLLDLPVPELTIGLSFTLGAPFAFVQLDEPTGERHRKARLHP